jgi:ethanolamine utilization protein EutA (predicted chaperonin)
MEEIKFSHTVVSYREPVVSLTFTEDSELDVAEIRELIAAAERLSGKKPYLLFSDARGNLAITPEARKVAAAKNEAPLLVANAVLVNNLGLSITANFFMKFNKPHFPVRVFYDEKKAMEWLMKFEVKK